MPEHIVNQEKIYRWIIEHTPEKGRVLDIGCGDGELLANLVEKRGARGTGIEISEECVMRAVQRGLSVHHGNVEEGLDHYDDGTFDLVIMSLTIQEIGDLRRVINEAFRVGKQIIVVFPNFGYWRGRWQLAISGRAPQTCNLPYSWHDSPNRHFFTVADWDDFCRQEAWRCLEKHFLAAGKSVGFLTNLRAEVAMYLMVKGDHGNE
jgi:methionine biosynthesis protein MetW